MTAAQPQDWLLDQMLPSPTEVANAEKPMIWQYLFLGYRLTRTWAISKVWLAFRPDGAAQIFETITFDQPGESQIFAETA